MTKKHNTLTHTPSVFFYNGLSSALSSLALRFASMVFNVYLSGIAGAGAMGLMSLIYSVWGFALTLGCVSGGFCCSRICANEFSLNGDIYRSTSMCIRFAAFCGSVVGGALFLSSSFFGGSVLGDPRCVLPLRILSLSLPFISMSGAVEGYFNACTRTYKTAFMRVLEQVTRISLTALIFFTLGHSDASEACINIVLGGAVTETLSFVILFIVFLFDRRKHCQRKDTSHCTYKRIVSLSLPVTLSTSLRSALISIEHVMIPRGLVAYGVSYECALATFGMVHGMALPIILFCYSLPSSFSGLLIPKIAEYDARSNKKEIAYVAKRAYRLALCFSFGVSAFIILSSELLGASLYPGKDVGRYLYVLAPLIPIMYVDSVSDSFLKGLNRQMYSMKINIIDSLISIACVALLMPRFGVWGYIAAIYASEIFNTCASLTTVIKLTGYRIPVFKFILLPLFISVLSSKLTDALYSFLDGAVSGGGVLIWGGIFYVILFGVLLLAFRNIDREESEWLCGVILPRKRENSKKSDNA